MNKCNNHIPHENFLEFCPLSDNTVDDTGAVKVICVKSIRLALIKHIFIIVIKF